MNFIKDTPDQQNVFNENQQQNINDNNEDIVFDSNLDSIRVDQPDLIP